MNNTSRTDSEHHRTLQILDELSKNDSLTQRDLSGRLGIALGLANSYLKNLVAKGFITVSSIPTRRYAYFLTPKGFAEKTRLSYQLLQDYTRIYREARRGFKDLFSELRNDGLKQVAFAGADEVAEIAYITLHEMGLELAGVLDDELAGKKFFGRDIKKINDIATLNSDCVVVTSYLKKEQISEKLLSLQVPKEKIKTVFA